MASALFSYFEQIRLSQLAVLRFGNSGAGGGAAAP